MCKNSKLQKSAPREITPWAVSRSLWSTRHSGKSIRLKGSQEEPNHEDSKGWCHAVQNKSQVGKWQFPFYGLESVFSQNANKSLTNSRGWSDGAESSRRVKQLEVAARMPQRRNCTERKPMRALECPSNSRNWLPEAGWRSIQKCEREKYLVLTGAGNSVWSHQ